MIAMHKYIVLQTPYPGKLVQCYKAADSVRGLHQFPCITFQSIDISLRKSNSFKLNEVIENNVYNN